MIMSSRRQLIQSIQEETVHFNQNNISRTMAYFRFFQRNPEVHWSFLAHMVSRNAGWNMTDLKGEFLPHLLNDEDLTHYFLMLERGNWLIFQDAYPQLLLYEISKKRGIPLFDLLPEFNVSRFIVREWSEFWKHGSCSRLTVSLITNEQHYIEARVIQHPFFQQKVLKKSSFSFQDLLSLNYILFPSSTSRKSVPLVLFGECVRNFTSLQERIEIGKRLYSILFQDKERLKSVYQWASTHPHTGSRMDYWPHLFCNVRETIHARLYNPHIKSCQLKKGVPRIYSPSLQSVWKKVHHPPASVGDWMIEGYLPISLTAASVHNVSSIHQEYCKAIEKLSFAAFTKKAFFSDF